MTAQLMDYFLAQGQEYRVASQIYLPKRRSKRWKHIVRVPAEEWQQANLFTATFCCRRYVATWEITHDKLFLNSLDGCYQLKAGPLWAEWVTATIRVVKTECWFFSLDSTFEREFVLPVINSVVAPNVVAE